MAPDKFKGSLSAAEVAAAIAEGLRAGAPDVEVRRVPVADGGEGTLEAAMAAGFSRVPVSATGPVGRAVATAYARSADRAVVELADTAGLGRLPGGVPDALRASSTGVGEVIAAALEAGCRRIVVGIGGSASTDGGAGLLTPLGVRVLRADGSPVAPGGVGLLEAARLDLRGLHPDLATAEVVVASDVDNPLTGPRGAAEVYAPQKGATRDDVLLLDRALTRWADLVAATTGRDLRDQPGAGAAGGVGFGLTAVAGARLGSGIDSLLDLLGFDEALADADLVITGEGSLDEQSLQGKAPVGVAAAAARAGVPTVAVCGRLLLSPEQVAGAGFVAAWSLADLEPEPAISMAKAHDLLVEVGRRIAEGRPGEPDRPRR